MMTDDSITVAKPILDLITSLEQDLEYQGWDLPAKLYIISGTEQDPHLRLALHSPDITDVLVPYPLPPTCIGLAVAFEAFQLKLLDEIRRDDPELAAMLTEGMPQGPALDEVWYHTMAHFAPSALPLELRTESRHVMVHVIGSDDAVCVMRKKNQTDVETMVMYGPIADALRNLAK